MPHVSSALVDSRRQQLVAQVEKKKRMQEAPSPHSMESWDLFGKRNLFPPIQDLSQSLEARSAQGPVQP